VFLKDNSFLPPDIIMSVYNHTPADDLAIATIRTLAVDTVGKANSGHPG
jgi:transketolase